MKVSHAFMIIREEQIIKENGIKVQYQKISNVVEPLLSNLKNKMMKENQTKEKLWKKLLSIMKWDNMRKIPLVSIKLKTKKSGEHWAPQKVFLNSLSIFLEKRNKCIAVMSQKLVSNNQNNILPTSSFFCPHFLNLTNSIFSTSQSNGWEAPLFVTFVEDK